MQKNLLFFSIIILSASAFLSSCAEHKSSVIAQTLNTVKTPAAATNQATEKSSNPKVSRPTIVSRQNWQAKNSIGKVKEQTIRYITIHHTATLQKEKVTLEKKLQSLQNFSQTESRLASGKMKPVWFDVPYHFYIAVDGKIAEGREIKFVGDTNTDYDPSGHALIVLEGNFETEKPAAEQQKSLQELAAWLSAQYKIPTSEIKAHNDYASTACPGENLKNLLPTLREQVAKIIKVSEKQ